jgi:hypothetical protein
MKHKKLITLLLVVLSMMTAAASRNAVGSQKVAPAPVVIPFELVTRHILIKVRINNSDPLWFIFDTGDKVAIVDLARARALGLSLHGEVTVGGAGAGTVKGATVRDASVKVLGVEGHPQPVMLAIPLDGLQPRFGHDIDGIIGADFIRQFVVEIDYPAKVLRLHEKDSFVYSGSGEIIATRFNNGGHPVVSGEVIVAGRPPIKGEFVVDVGSGSFLALNRPFVERERLSAPKTIRMLGGGGVGGRVTGRVGRIAGLKIGNVHIENTLALFSEDRAGAFSTADIQGNIGAQILSKFKVLLDYSRERIILEPNATFKDTIGPATGGVRLIAEGSSYKTFRVEELLEDSPAVEAGLQTNDVIEAVNGRPAAELTLSMLQEIFEKPAPQKLSVRRGSQVVQITLTPRRLV